MDSEDALQAVWRAELLARLALIDQMIAKSREATTSEEQSNLLEMTRQHYVRLLDQLSVDGKLPTWSDLDP
jgi:hypothetical protein